MVSWGTTANVSIPLDALPDPLPAGLARDPGAPAAAGCWRAASPPPARCSPGSPALTGVGVAALRRRRRRPVAAGRPRACSPFRGWAAPGPRGGAPTPGAAFLGLGPVARRRRPGPGRASRRWPLDVARCLEAGGTAPVALMLALAGGAADPAWVDVLTGSSGLPAVRRRCARQRRRWARRCSSPRHRRLGARHQPGRRRGRPDGSSTGRLPRPGGAAVGRRRRAAALAVPPTPGFTVSG